MYINGYNMSTEVASFLLSLLILFLMFFSKPRKTKNYLYNFLGLIYSLMIILVEEYLVYQTENPLTFNPLLFNITCMAYYIFYHGILIVIFLYVTRLASNKAKLKVPTGRTSVCACIIFAAIAAFLCFNGYMYGVDQSGRIYLTKYFFTYLAFGVADVVAVSVVSFGNRRNIAKIIYFFIWIFIPIELLLLGLQFYQRDILFTSLTYVLPFTLFYMLFHSNPYDENSGCQNNYSFETRLMANKRYRRRYMIVYVTFPTLKNDTLPYSEDEIQLAIAESCRKAEKTCFGIHMYTLNSSSYAFFINKNDREKSKEVFEKLHQILDRPLTFHNQPVSVKYKMVGFFDNEYVKNMKQMTSMIHFLLNKIEHQNQVYFCEEEDYVAFYRQYQIFQMLMDIRDTNDLNDERVLCYTQPIYDIQKKSFRTAEALMRLSLNGKVIYPDQFIELAEGNNCIHILTRIMLNKVCQNIKALNQKYDFDAITVNCSTSEFSDRNLHKELLEIIHMNDIPTSKIRLELTESAMAKDFEAVLYNMNQLKAAGIDFYLDDFGTGYSNMERIVSCPFKTIKFDKCLLYKVIEDENVNVLVKSMVEVFRNLGLVLLIEGVEDTEHRDYSIEQGFDYI